MSFSAEFTSTHLPTPYGSFQLHVRTDSTDEQAPILLTMGDLRGKPPLVRLHSECLTGDALHSLRCDCGFQLKAALSFIATEQRGAIVYLRQEGRGIGLVNKLRAYALQDQGLDTVEANLKLGFEPDQRDYGEAVSLLKSLELSAVRLMTNNPAKVQALRQAGIAVTERVPIDVGNNSHNVRYLMAKSRKLGHLL
ncbi:GTP cyclohydrolase II [Permianibacter sp. IMCC34836]|uniref:GTP cyclohydrolase II n=1 Tax=Permianibacter fluminis TaxID=2738515 RepID=UPI001557B4E6|nr:GTP cyclohydrolase II [Permianibacter fluminis]NQD35974.1 GTP cyclohydrolase II [Permianibacter fluminis]